MKIRISDMMNQIDGDLLGTQPIDAASLERIREKTMMKIHGEKIKNRRHGLTRKGIAAIVLAAALCISGGACALMNWAGFAKTDGLSQREIAQLLEQADLSHMEVVEADGTVHSMNQAGKEVSVRTVEQSAADEKKQLEERNRAAIKSTDLADVSAMEFIPNSITEVTTDAQGDFSDFALGNGCGILLHPKGERGYRLSAGDVVTLNLGTDALSSLTVGQFRNGTLLEEHAVNGAPVRDSIVIGEDGVYVFSLIYAGAGAGSFTDCSLTVH